MEKIREIGLYESRCEKLARLWSKNGKIIFFFLSLLLNLFIVLLPVYPSVIYIYSGVIALLIFVLLRLTCLKINISWVSRSCVFNFSAMRGNSFWICGSWALISNLLMLTVAKYLAVNEEFETKNYIIAMIAMSFLAVAVYSVSSKISRWLHLNNVEFGESYHNQRKSFTDIGWLSLLIFLIFAACADYHEKNFYDLLLQRKPAETIMSFSLEKYQEREVYLVRLQDRIEIIDPQDYPELYHLGDFTKIVIVKKGSEKIVGIKLVE